MTNRRSANRLSTNRVSTCALATALALLAASAASAGWDEGVAAFKAGNYAQAIAEFQQFVEERPDEEALVVGYQMLARSLLRGGKAEESVAAFQKHLELKPGDLASQIGLGQAYYEAGMPRECVTTLNRLNVGSLPEPHQIQVYQMRSASQARLGNTRGAAADLGKVADLKGDAKTRFEYGRLLQSDAPAGCRAHRLRAGDFDGRQPGGVEEDAGQRPEDQGSDHTGLGQDGHLRQGSGCRQKPRGEQSLLRQPAPSGEMQLGGKSYDAAGSTFQQAISKKANDWHPHFYLGSPMARSSVTTRRKDR